MIRCVRIYVSVVLYRLTIMYIVPQPQIYHNEFNMGLLVTNVKKNREVIQVLYRVKYSGLQTA